MANPHRGEVALKAGGEAYKFSYSVNALCELEDALDQPVAKIAVSLRDPASVRWSVIRALVWAGLRDHHQDVTIEQAGDICEAAGLGEVMVAIGAAFDIAFPENKKGKAENPRKAKG
jgi:hypothetical protein